MVLIIDNSQKHADSLKRILEMRCLRSETVLSGREALKKILYHRYKLILLNLEMPDMTGFEIADTINGLKKIEDVPIIFFSEAPLSIDFDHYRYIWDYVTAPFNAPLLLHKIEHAIHYYDKISILKKSQHLLVEELGRKKIKSERLQKNKETADGKEG